MISAICSAVAYSVEWSAITKEIERQSAIAGDDPAALAERLEIMSRRSRGVLRRAYSTAVRIPRAIAEVRRAHPESEAALLRLMANGNTISGMVDQLEAEARRPRSKKHAPAYRLAISHLKESP